MIHAAGSVSIVFFGLLTLEVACSSSPKDSAHDGGSDGLNGGSGGHPPVGGNGGGPLGGGTSDIGGRSVDGGVSMGGRSDTGGGLASGGSGSHGGASTGGGDTAGNRSTAANTGSGGRSTGGAGTSAGGTAGSGGPSTAGNTGSGGKSLGGTTASGGSRTGGSGGNAQVDGGGADGPGTDAMADGPVDIARDADTDGASSMTLDSCFADLPKPVGAQMVASKQSSDNRVRIRIAIDDENRAGTSGGSFWGFIRLAVEVDGEVTCIKDRASLNYTNTHHNCVDSATAISGSMTYSLTMPNRSPAESPSSTTRSP